MNTVNTYENGNMIIVKYNNKEHTGRVEDSAGNGDYKVLVLPVIKGRLWWKQEQIVRLANQLETERFNTLLIEWQEKIKAAKKEIAAENKQEKKSMAASKKDIAEKMEKEEKQEQPEVKTILEPFSMPASRTYINVKIPEIISLKKTTIRNAGEAMRGISRSHVIHLINERDTTKFPPIRCQRTNQGWVCLDGYHRLNRVVDLAILEFYKIQTGIDVFVDQETGGLSEVDQATLDKVKKELQPHQKALDAFVAETSIRVQPTNFNNENDVVEFAFRANMHHGMVTNDTTRVRYAWWLHVEKGYSYRAAAAEAGGISHVAVINYGKRDARVTEAVTSGEVTAERVAETKQLVSDAKDEKKRNALATALRNAWEDCKDNDMDVTINWLKDSFKVTDVETCAGMSRVLAELGAYLAKEASK